MVQMVVNKWGNCCHKVAMVMLLGDGQQSDIVQYGIQCFAGCPVNRSVSEVFN